MIRTTIWGIDEAALKIRKIDLSNEEGKDIYEFTITGPNHELGLVVFERELEKIKSLLYQAHTLDVDESISTEEWE